MSQRTIRDIIGQKATDTITVNSSPTNNTNALNTRKHTHNYAILHEYGLDGSPEPSSPTPKYSKKSP